MNKLVADIKNWRTTIVGFLTGLIICATQIIAALDSDPETVFNMNILLAGLAAMGIGVFAKDGDKTSKELGLE